MTLDEFVSRYNGKKVSNGGLSQCVALARQYLDDVLKVPQFPTVQGAYQIFDVLQGFEKVLNTPTGVPPRGAIIIWKKEYGGVGHVGIVLQADVKGILVFSQNHTGNLDPCEVTSYSYNLVKGWLIRKDDMIPADKVKGRMYDSEGKLLYWIPDPDTVGKYFGDLGEVKPISEIVPPVEKIIEKPVDVPFETIRYEDKPETLQKLADAETAKNIAEGTLEKTIEKHKKEVETCNAKIKVYEQTESEEIEKIKSEYVLIRRAGIAEFFKRLYNLIIRRDTK